MTDFDLIEHALSPFRDVFDRMAAVLTREHAFSVFEQISETYSPSLAARHTTGETIRKLLSAWPNSGAWKFHKNYQRTGNTAVALGQVSQKPVWLLAHMDIISFLTGERTVEGYRLTPFCVPRASDGAHPAVALGNVPEDGRLPEIAQGTIVVKDNGRTLLFATDALDLPPATRVVYAAQAEWNRQTNLVTGYVDDAVGCAALTLAIDILANYPVEALFVYCDEEEGVVAPGPRAFSRGSDRLFNRAPVEQLPNFVIVSDGYDMAANPDPALYLKKLGEGALFAAFSSETRGTVTPPRLLQFERALAHYLQQHDIELREYTGYTSRSDDISAIRATPNIALIAMPTAYSHFAHIPRMHLDDLLNLAKTLVVFTLIAQSSEWQIAVLD